MQDFFHVNPSQEHRPRVMGLSASPAADKRGEHETKEKLAQLLSNLKCSVSSPLLWQYQLLLYNKTPKLRFHLVGNARSNFSGVIAAIDHMLECILHAAIAVPWAFAHPDSPSLLSSLREHFSLGASWYRDENFVAGIVLLKSLEKEIQGHRPEGFWIAKSTSPGACPFYL